MYPIELLPHLGLSKINIKELDDTEYIRTIPFKIINAIEDGSIQLDIIKWIVYPNGENEVFELSTFLYGVYQPCHCSIIVSEKLLTSDWNYSEEIDPSSIVFSENSNIFPVFLFGKKIIGKNISIVDDKKIEHQVFLSIDHMPTRCNYWHFEFYIVDDKGTRITRKIRSAWSKRIANKILEDVVFLAIDQELSCSACS